MTAWQVVHSILAVLGTGAVSMVAVACVWPINQPRRHVRAQRLAADRCHLRPIPWPKAWTCGPPGGPLTLAEAHAAMQLHRGHDCARKHAAFDALVAAGRIHPDSARRHRLWGSPW